MLGLSVVVDNLAVFSACFNEDSSISQNSIKLIFMVKGDKGECSDESCEDSHHHCLHHTSANNYLFPTRTKISFSRLYSLLDKNLWHYFYHYKEPSLDSALKPPLFS